MDGERVSVLDSPSRLSWSVGATSLISLTLTPYWANKLHSVSSVIQYIGAVVRMSFSERAIQVPRDSPGMPHTHTSGGWTHSQRAATTSQLDRHTNAVRHSSSWLIEMIASSSRRELTSDPVRSTTHPAPHLDHPTTPSEHPLEIGHPIRRLLTPTSTPPIQPLNDLPTNENIGHPDPD